MTCEALINKFLLDYHAGTLPLARKIDFEIHIALCPACRKYLAAYCQTIILAKSTATVVEEPPPPELIEAILKVTRDP